MKIVINGAGVAGPALAYWLVEGGHEVLLVEEAPRFRSGGYIIDFWGLGYDICEKMGLIPQIRKLGYQVEEVRLVDENGRKNGGFGVDVFGRMTKGRFTSVRRSDLSRTIYDSVADKIETIFGDSIASIEEHNSGVRVGFDRVAPRDFDLVVGADGLHSRVRELAFGAEAAFEKDLGYYVAAFEADGYEPRDELVYMSHGTPGKQISRFSMRDNKTLFLFVFEGKFVTGMPLTNDGERRSALRKAFADVKWESPQILREMDRVSEIYFDRVSQIHLENWSMGRTVLIGDAAACVSLLAGEGTGLAITEAYVLAGELNKCGGDYLKAFDRYHELLKPFLTKKQNSAAKFASSFAPSTSMGLAFRNLVTKLMRISWIADYFIGRDLRDDIELPNYDFQKTGQTV
ncbi:MAG: FAD-binding domain [Pyrinomonadaceae bacterium]